MIGMNKNMLVLAYLGDSVYELYVRKYLVDKGICKVNDLQKESIKYVSAKSQFNYLKELQSESIKYVSAKGQANYLKEMIDNNFFNEEELYIIICARNHKSNHKPKNCDIITYNWSTGFEALIGYLYLENKIDRLEEIINYILNKK